MDRDAGVGAVENGILTPNPPQERKIKKRQHEYVRKA